MCGYMMEICEILSINYHMCPAYVPHIFPALTVLYYPWVEKSLQEAYKNDVDTLIENTSPKCQSVISLHKKKCSSKKRTQAGLERKHRIVEKLFDHRSMTDLHISL